MSSAIFPILAGLEYPVIRTPIFRTLIQESTSGKETRVALWSYPRWKWTLSFNFLRDDGHDEFRTLLGFFLARQGAYDSFRFDDVDDRLIAAQPIGVGTGSATAFQLVRSLGGFTEPVFAPNSVSAVSVSNVPVASGGWSVDEGTGVLSLVSPPANGAEVTVDFTYYWPVRFMADDNDFSKFMNKLWEQKKLEFESVK